MNILQVLLLTLAAYAAKGAYLYQDEFDYFDSSKWVIEVTDTPHNNEYQSYTSRSDNVKVEDGHLVITPLKENYNGRQYTSGRLHSTFSWLYGRVEVKAKLPNGYGLWPAIWMMPQDSVYGGWPWSGEIDICEARGQNLYDIGSTIHYEAPWGHAWTGSGDMKTQCPIDEYHIYTLDWTPDSLVYKLDGNAYYEQDISGYTSSSYNSPHQPFDQAFYMILNVAIGGDYLDGPDANTVWNYPDAEMYVDYVRVTALEDLSTCECVVADGASASEVCGNVNWACYDQSYADVSAECTDELLNCCAGSVPSCTSATIDPLASAVYTAYDDALNDDSSCNFSGTATKDCTSVSGDTIPAATCVINDDATNSEICGSMIWACGGDNTYADVSSECNDANGSVALNCCYSDPNTCNDATLRQAAGEVFQLYYATIPSSTSCDFGGICHLEGDAEPIACSDNI